jgi:hypothetical protein
MQGTMFAVHLWATCRVGSFWSRAATWFDNEYYLELVTTIRNWHTPGTDITQHFWGFPYAIALVSKLFAIQALTALVMISVLASLAVCILVHRL